MARQRKSFTIPADLFDSPGYSRLMPMEKGVLLAIYGECDSYGIVPILKVGRRSEMDLLGHEALEVAIESMVNAGVAYKYEAEGHVYLQLAHYDKHLSSQQLNRRRTQWPHNVNIQTHSDSKGLPSRTLKRVLRPVTSQPRQTTINKNTNDSKSLTNKARSNNCKTRARSEDFETFWESYRITAKSFGRNPGSRKEAHIEWLKEKRNLADIMQGLSLWAQSQDWKDGIIRHACRWLKAEMWKDEPIPAKNIKPHFQPAPTAKAVVLTEDDIPF